MNSTITKTSENSFDVFIIFIVIIPVLFLMFCVLLSSCFIILSIIQEALTRSLHKLTYLCLKLVIELVKLQLNHPIYAETPEFV